MKQPTLTGRHRWWTAALLAPAVVSRLALAAPIGGVVASGSAAITQRGAVTTIDQASPVTVINWQGFSVAAGESVRFNQPGASAVALNRVVGNERSVIDGALGANGQVFLVNSNGVLFGKGSSVSVGSLVASTLDIGDADFLAGRRVFSATSRGAVTNLGTLTARDGGYVALLGGQVSNQGVITATRGTVALAAGGKVMLNFNGDTLLGLTLDQGALDALVENRQALYADGGQVILTARAADELLSAQVNNAGLVRAQTLDDLQGRITLLAQGGVTQVGGTLDASAPLAGDGGSIETSGDVVRVADAARITTRAAAGRSGTWLIDPTDFTIAASGGDITGAALAAQLANGSVTVASTAGAKGTGGDVSVNDMVSWDAPTTLTLKAEHDIAVNSPVTASYSAYSGSAPALRAGLTLDAGHDIHVNNAIRLTNAALAMTCGGDYDIRTQASYSGSTLDANGLPVAKADTSGGTYGSISFGGSSGSGDALSINGQAYTLIYSMSQLDGLDNTDGVTGNGNYDAVLGHFAIARDLEAAGTTYSVAPIYFFGGTLAGLGHQISHFSMDAPQYSAGLIGNGTDYGPVTIRDLGMVSVSVTNAALGGAVGALIGEGGGVLSQVYSTGTMSVLGGKFGGVAGAFNGTISSSFSGVSIASGRYNVGDTGGLVGAMTGTIGDSHATGSIDVVMSAHSASASGLGGLVGSMTGTISNAYATGAVTARYADGVAAASYDIKYLGGLVGAYASRASDSLTRSFATGSVTGGSYLGGLLGGVRSSKGLLIDNAYATGDVTGIYPVQTAFSAAYLGGLIGVVGDPFTATLSGSISISHVFATGNVNAKGGGSNVGGLIGYAASGSTPGSLTSAYATGQVSVASIDGIYTDSAGGLVGGINHYAVSDVYAKGDVHGYSHVGGLIGTAVNATISKAYETGAATAVDQTNYGAGGLVGFLNNTSTTNTYYNGDVNSRAFFGSFGGGTHDTKGLTGNQIADGAYYANGTIGQVIAAREAAAAAAAQKKAFEAAALAVGARALAASPDGTRPTAVAARAPLRSTAALALDQNLVISTARYSADIRGIEVDGQRFELEEKGEPKK
ncbi:filamentous hemagglutinin N-terminal domain-containing protein [Roseateles sp. BYS96W]|uniref:Filamentous hemagglutinin N-terminal domain-containing protein n=1 Tax=Pelomonas nitida TaxID=3299027 RepID=A0ABW7G6C9_9BURK